MSYWRHTTMPKYSDFKIAGCYLYFTSTCIIEAMHAHASDKRLTETGSAKFWVRQDGSTLLAKQGRLTDRQVRKIQEYIKINFISMCEKWADFKGLNDLSEIEFKSIDHE